MGNPKLNKQFENLVQSAPEPKWVTSMMDFYHDNRRFRTEDLQRVLGDQTEGAVMPKEDANLTSDAHHFMS